MNMDDKQKQIEEMAKAMCEEYDTDICKHECPMATDCANIFTAKRLIAAGYRKQSETAKEIWKWLKFLYVERQKEYTNWDGNKINAVATEWLNADIEAIAAHYGVEVEE